RGGRAPRDRAEGAPLRDRRHLGRRPDGGATARRALRRLPAGRRLGAAPAAPPPAGGPRPARRGSELLAAEIRRRAADAAQLALARGPGALRSPRAFLGTLRARLGAV